MRAFAALIIACLTSVVPLQAEELTVFAAASMQDALNEAGHVWAATQGHEVRVAAAGSAVLARQIAQGAPADIYISASPIWMDWLDQQGQIQPETRRDVAGNALVLIGADPYANLDEAFAALKYNRLAVALTEAVPAGIYAREALMAMGRWEAVKMQLAETEHVRAALALVALGEAPLGIVYLSDALSEARVHVLHTFAEATHSPIRYPAAVVSGTKAAQAADDFLCWLAGAEGQAILARHGFGAAL